MSSRGQQRSRSFMFDVGMGRKGFSWIYSNNESWWSTWKWVYREQRIRESQDTEKFGRRKLVAHVCHLDLTMDSDDKITRMIHDCSQELHRSFRVVRLWLDCDTSLPESLSFSFAFIAVSFLIQPIWYSSNPYQTMTITSQSTPPLA